MGEHLPVTLMRERWQGLAQATPPPLPVLPLHPKTQLRNLQPLLSNCCHTHHLPPDVIFGDLPPFFPLLAALSQRLAASRLITLKCSAGRYSLQLAGIAKSI